MEVKKYRNISSNCTPVAPSRLGQVSEPQPRVWSLTQQQGLMAGNDSLTLSALSERIHGVAGEYRGQILHPVMAECQRIPEVAAALRAYEFRAAATVDGQTGLVYRQHPSAGRFPSSWLVSAESAMNSIVGSWGTITSDHESRVYRHEKLNLPGRSAPVFPDLGKLIDEVFADFVIDRPDHPALQRILPGYSPPVSSEGTTGDLSNAGMEDDDAIY